MYEDEYQYPAIVIDNGSYQCKAGVAGDDTPRTYFPCLVGIPKLEHYYGINIDYYIGDEALARKWMVSFRYPFEDGVITNYDYMERIWHDVLFEQLRVTPEDHPVLITESPLVSLFQREKVIQTFFETFNVPQFYAALSPVLSLYSEGRTTGLVIDSGADATFLVPVYEGYYVPYRVEKFPFAGNACNQYLISLNRMEGVFINDLLTVRDMKEKVCYVANDYEEEIKKSKKSSANYKMYESPDGEVIVVKEQRFQCPELFFKPKQYDCNSEALGLPQLVSKTIMKCEIDMRKDLYGNIIFSGGSTMFPGIIERLYKELRPLVPEKIDLKFRAPPDRKTSVWMGGSILAQLSTFKDMQITRKEYDEAGTTIIHRKCQR